MNNAKFFYLLLALLYVVPVGAQEGKTDEAAESTDVAVDGDDDDWLNTVWTQVDDMVEQLSHLFEKKKAVLLPGRWQPLHVGHEWLIQRELDQGKRVVVGIRDTPVSESDPYSADMRKRMIEHRYEGEDVEAWIMPDIEAISYGRKVGYDLREADDIPPEVFAVSATGVRGGNRANVSQKVMEFMISERIWDGE